MSIGLDSIKKPATDPTTVEDELTQQERLNLSPKELVRLEHEQLVRRLDRQIADLNDEKREQATELVRLHTVEIQHGVLKCKHTLSRKITIWMAVAMVLGSVLVSSFPISSDPLGFGFGWGLVLVGVVVHLIANSCPRDNEPAVADANTDSTRSRSSG